MMSAAMVSMTPAAKMNHDAMCVILLRELAPISCGVLDQVVRVRLCVLCDVRCRVR